MERLFSNRREHEEAEPGRPRRVARSVQRQLIVGPAADPAEREADRIADRVLGLIERPSAIPAEAETRIQPAARAPAVDALSRAGDSRIQRNGDGFFGSVKSFFDMTAMRVRFVADWDWNVTEKVANHFGMERFKQMVSAAGGSTLSAVGSARLLQGDPANPFSVPTMPFKAAVATAAAWGLPIATIRQEISAANQADRDTVWQDAAVLATMRTSLALDDYLGLLPMLRVLTPAKGETTADRWGSYDTQTLGPMVDTVIRTHLSAYVGGAVTAGRHVEGEMSVVGDEDWNLAFKRQWKKKELQPFITGANAFVDVNQPARHIWIHKDRGGPGTAIHEGFHKYASPVLRDTLINNFRGGGNDVCNLDEGLTEYFTRLVIARGKLTYKRSSYPSQFDAVEKLKAKVDETVLAKAYFDGDLAGLAAEFKAKTTHDFDAYAQALEKGDYATANGML